MKEIKLPSSKYKHGYTSKEVLDIIRPLKIHYKTFWKKFGANTCSISPDTKETLYYGCDIITTIRGCLEKRDKYFYEWD